MSEHRQELEKGVWIHCKICGAARLAKDKDALADFVAEHALGHDAEVAIRPAKGQSNAHST